MILSSASKQYNTRSTGLAQCLSTAQPLTITNTNIAYQFYTMEVQPSDFYPHPHLFTHMHDALQCEALIPTNVSTALWLTLSCLTPLLALRQRCGTRCACWTRHTSLCSWKHRLLLYSEREYAQDDGLVALQSKICHLLLPDVSIAMVRSSICQPQCPV